MAAHYRLKYGIDKNEFTKSFPALKHSHDSLQSTLSTSITSAAVPSIQEMDSDSDSDHTGATIPTPSPRNARRTKSHEPQLNNSFPTTDFRRQTPREGNVPSPKFRHSSYIPSSQSGYDQLNFSKETYPGSRYVNAPSENKSLSSPSLQIPNHYDYIRHSIAVVEEITEVYESSPVVQRHRYENLKRPMDIQEGTYIRMLLCISHYLYMQIAFFISLGGHLENRNLVDRYTHVYVCTIRGFYEHPYAFT